MSNLTKICVTELTTDYLYAPCESLLKQNTRTVCINLMSNLTENWVNACTLVSQF